MEWQTLAVGGRQLQAACRSILGAARKYNSKWSSGFILAKTPTLSNILVLLCHVCHIPVDGVECRRGVVCECGVI